jgi:AAA domain (dynein-related subfamily)
LLDLVFGERGLRPMKESLADSDRIRSKWFDHLMPVVEPARVKEILDERRFVILQGPPGTGKTKMATDLLANEYGGNGRTIQFHANTTYEAFVGGLAPVPTEGALGLAGVARHYAYCRCQVQAALAGNAAQFVVLSRRRDPRAASERLITSVGICKSCQHATSDRLLDVSL